MAQVEDAKFTFFKKNLIIQKNYSCKDYLLFAIIPFRQVFLLSQIFLECFLLEFAYFLSFMTMKICLVYYSNTDQPLQ